MYILHKADCLDKMKEMQDKSVDVVFTSPPYNRKRNDKYANYDDAKADYFGFLCDSIDEMIRVCKGNVYMNIQKNYYNKEDVFRVIGKYAKEICEIFVWEKSNPMPASGFNITNAYEFIIVFGKSIKSNKTYTKNHLTTSVARMTKIHKAMMNPAISDFFVKNFTREGDTILDPFMGTGTTGVSCMALGRFFVGIEIDEEYFRVSKKRIGEIQPSSIIKEALQSSIHTLREQREETHKNNPSLFGTQTCDRCGLVEEMPTRLVGDETYALCEDCFNDQTLTKN
jgi:site-specific DNA-methyltransferase (adenine-specific)